ncbi:MAG: AAA family ATPase [Bacillota bacterium]|nr:AAA family ATPase [Bacillota bacterium]
MKKLIIINGTMGVGKSTVSKELSQRLQNSVWLDGDWCWMMNPWNFSDENKSMVIDNICYILSNFLKNSSFEYVIFCWVLHLESITDLILERLKSVEFQTFKITLTCAKEELVDRIIKRDGIKSGNVEKSIDRLSLYESMNTIKIDTSDLKVEEIVANIIKIL